jgi:hypothetical protein
MIGTHERKAASAVVTELAMLVLKRPIDAPIEIADTLHLDHALVEEIKADTHAARRDSIFVLKHPLATFCSSWLKC